MTTAVSQNAFAGALLDPTATLEGISAWNGSDPMQRFNVYRNNVTVSLIEALRATFPVVEQLVGEDFFRNLARDHVRQSPPRSPLLARYGEDFADFIAGYPPAAGLPYLADVARLEAARVRAYHAADAPSLEANDFARLPAETLAGVRVILHPSALVIGSDFAIVSLWGAHQGAISDVNTIEPYEPEDALVLRPHDEVLVFGLPPGIAEALQKLQDGEPLGDALSSTTIGFDPIAAFQLIVASGVVSALTPVGD